MATKGFKDIIRKGILKAYRHQVDLNDSRLQQYSIKRIKAKRLEFQKNIYQQSNHIWKRLGAALPMAIGMCQLVLDSEE